MKKIISLAAFAIISTSLFAQTLTVDVTGDNTVYSRNTEYTLVSNGYFRVNKVESDSEMSVTTVITGEVFGQEMSETSTDGSYDRTSNTETVDIDDDLNFIQIKVIEENGKHYLIREELDAEAGIFKLTDGNKVALKYKIEVQFIDGNFADYQNRGRTTVVTTMRGLSDHSTQAEENLYSITKQAFLEELSSDEVSIESFELLNSDIEIKSQTSYTFNGNSAHSKSLSEPLETMNLRAVFKGTMNLGAIDN